MLIRAACLPVTIIFFAALGCSADSSRLAPAGQEVAEPEKNLANAAAQETPAGQIADQAAKQDGKQEATQDLKQDAKQADPAPGTGVDSQPPAAAPGRNKPDEKIPPPAGAGTGSTPATPAGAQHEPTREELEESVLAEKILGNMAKIPHTSKQVVPKISLKDLKALSDETLEYCAKYLQTFQAPRAPQRVKVLYVAIKLLAINHKRSSELPEYWRSEDSAAQFERMFALVKEARALPMTPDEEMLISKAETQALYLARRYQDALSLNEALLKQYPSDPDRDETWMGLIRIVDDLALRERVKKECAAFLKEFPRSEFLPFVISSYAKACTEAGDPRGAIAVWQEYLELILNGMEGKAVKIKGEDYVFPESAKNDFLLQAEQVHFWLGFNHYALGEIDAAIPWYEKSVEFLNKLNAEKHIDQPGKVFLERAIRELSTLTGWQGQPGKSLSEVVWSESEALDVEKEKGSVVALFFSTSGTARWHPFPKMLEEYGHQRMNDGFRSAWISYGRGKKDLQEQVRAFAAQVAELGITYPIGLDATGVDSPGREAADRWRVYKSYNCPVGGATLVVLNREGKVAWYKMDPTANDIYLAISVFDRLLAAGKKAN